MALRDRLIERATETFTEWTGLELVESEPYERLREEFSQYETLARDSEDLAFWVLNDPMGGRGTQDKDLRRETRVRISQASRRAWSRDPIAGTEAEHYANFTLGRGVNRPVCKDEQVQEIVDRAWKDSSNQQHLCSLDALRAISNELVATSNVFLVAFRGKGKVRIGFLPSDDVRGVVTYPGDPQLPLYYVAQVDELKWDFDADRWEPKTVGDMPKTYYFPHWRNVEELADDPAIEGYKPKQEKLKDGGVYHLRTNRLLEQMFGMPRWNRTLRFMTSLNKLVEARVSMAQASASIIAKRVVKGGKSDVMKAATSVLQQAGEIGAGRAPTPAGPAATRAPIRPGSFHVENDGDNLQAFNLQSGSAQAMQDIQIIRGQAVSPSILGQHLYGDQSASSLGTSSTLELPANMAMGAWQENLEQVLRWFTDLVIEEAVRSGELGGVLPDEEDDGSPLKEEFVPAVRRKALSELCLTEAEDQAEAERRTGKDLTYTFEMPYPGRRNLPDITTAFTTVMTQLSPSGENEVLTKVMLGFFLTHGLQLENASELAEEITDAQTKLIKEQQQQAADAQQAQLDAMNQNPDPAADPAARPSDGGPVGTGDASPDTRNRGRADSSRPVYGEPRQAAVQEGLEDLPEDVRAEVEKILAGISETYVTALADPAAEAAERLNGHRAA